ncbi:MAG TPA: MucB/RseB C-terminal domain-containing protein [Solimonas sp.]|nr:MucB/RseB C-terminal domain-containing protein [Solimonas sp.]
MRARAAIGAAALALAPGVFAGPPAERPAAEPAEWLVKMSEAARTANYQGTIVYQDDDMLETMRLTHRFENGVERERVQALTGEPREIQKQDSKVTCLLPRDRKLTMERPTPKGLFPGLSRERLQQLAAVYEFDDLGTARLAGRVCRGVAITPRDDLRYGYEVWADEKTNVPLKVNLIGRDGSVLEQMMFTEIDFPAAIPDTAFQTELKPEGYREVTRTAGASRPASTAGGTWQFKQLPPGFHVTMRDVRTLADGGTVEHVLLSDGLSAISIFSANKSSPAKVFPWVSQMGAVHAYGRMMGSFHVTVIGEAPPQTVRMIGDNLRPGEAGPEPVSAPASSHKP